MGRPGRRDRVHGPQLPAWPCVSPLLPGLCGSSHSCIATQSRSLSFYDTMPLYSIPHILSFCVCEQIHYVECIHQFIITVQVILLQQAPSRRLYSCLCGYIDYILYLPDNYAIFFSHQIKQKIGGRVANHIPKAIVEGLFLPMFITPGYLGKKNDKLTTTHTLNSY